MATLQGICRNCGSLIMVDDRDSECECIFCNCVFPTSEAIEIFENPDGREFPNEHFEKSADGQHHYANRVYSTESLEKAVKRQELSESNTTDSVKKFNEFEVSPNDVKAPPKVTAIVIAASAAVVLGSVLIALPRYNERLELRAKIADGISGVCEGIASVDTTEDDSGFTKGYMIAGQSCDTIKIFTEDELDEEAVRTLYNNYCELRNNCYSGNDNEVTMTIYSSGSIFTVSNDSGSVEITED